MKTITTGFLSLALGLGLSAGAFAQATPSVAPAKTEVSKAADKAHEAKAPAKKLVEHKVAPVKPGDEKKAVSTAPATTPAPSAPKESPKPQAAAPKPVK